MDLELGALCARAAGERRVEFTLALEICIQEKEEDGKQDHGHGEREGRESGRGRLGAGERRGGFGRRRRWRWRERWVQGAQE